MLLLVFVIGFLATPIGAQDENSEDAFEIRRDLSRENEGMDTFIMSTAVLEPDTTTKTATEAQPGATSPPPDEMMGEDPFEPASSPIKPDPAPSTGPPSSTEPATENTTPSTDADTTSQVTTEVKVGEIATTTEKNIEVSTEASSASVELEETIPTIAGVWTTSTETAERRVLKEKSGEELDKKDPVEETTAVQVTVPNGEENQDGGHEHFQSTVHIGESTTKTSAEDVEEAPFDSSNLGGLFEADGSPKVEESSPAFPIALLPQSGAEQEEHSEEIIEKEKVASTEGATDSTTEAVTTMETTVATTEADTPKVEEVTMEERTSTAARTTMELDKKVEAPKKLLMMKPASVSRTPVTLKITSIEWMNDFANSTSGKFRKLTEQILPALSTLLRNELGDDFVSVDIDSYARGSVVVNVIMSTKEPVADPEQLATRLESTIFASGQHLGGNTVDPASITVNGVPSRAYVDKVNRSYAPAATSPLLIAAVIAVASVLLILVVVLICLINNRRSHGGMKMGLPSVEEGPPRGYGVPQLNSLSYTSSSRNTGMQPRPDEREVA